MTVAFISELLGRLTGKEVLITHEGVRTMLAKLTGTSAKAERELGAAFRPLVETCATSSSGTNRIQCPQG